MYTNKHLYIKESAISGYGVYTSANIESGAILYHCVDLDRYYKCLSIAEIDELPPNNLGIFLTYAIQCQDNQWIGPITIEEPNDDISIYWNHSCDPNSYFLDTNIIVASRDIESGEELTYDYCTTDTHDFGDAYMEYFPYHTKCYCGSAKCRGIVRHDDWQNPDIQKKYHNQFLPYIQQKIKKETK